MASGTINNPMAITELTGITVTSTDARYKSASTDISCYRSGRVVQLHIETRWDFSSTSCEEGDTLVLTVNGAPLPVSSYYCPCYHSARLYTAGFNIAGGINIRAQKGSNTNSNAPIAFTFVYITTD